MSDGSIQKRDKTELAPSESHAVMLPPGYEFAPEPIAEETGSHLWDYLGLIWHRRWLVLLMFFLCVGIAGHMALRARPFYQAVAKLEIKQPEGMRVLSSKFEPIEDRQAVGYLESQLQILQSRSLARRVVERLDLFAPRANGKPAPEKPPTKESPVLTRLKSVAASLKAIAADEANNTSETTADPAAAEMRARVGAFLSSLRVTQVRGTQIVEVALLGTDPDLCTEAANTLCEEYISWIYQSKSDSYKKALESLREELDAAKGKLAESEKALHDFARKNDLSFPVGDTGEFSRQLGETKRQLEEAERSLFDRKLRLQRFDSGTSVAIALSDNPRAQKLIDALLDLDSQIVRAKEQFGPEMTELRAHEAAKRELQSQLEIEYRRAKEKAQFELQETEAAHKFLNDKYDQQYKALAKMQAIDDYNSLKEEVDLNREIHNSLRQRERELIVTSRVQVGNVAIIEEAEPQPKFPNKVRTVVLGAFIGLFLGVLLVLFLDYMDTTIKGAQEVERLTQLPTLGYIPRFRNGWLWARKTHVELVAHEQPKSLIAESFRYLRTSVLYSLPGRSPGTILVTSSTEGEGKTTVAANLAIAFAQKGKKVLLLDADLMRPGLHRFFNVERSKGLSEILTGKLDEEIGCDARDPFRNTGIKNLFLLPCGARVPNPVDLLDSDSMRDLMALLSEEYEHVIIDSAPLTIRADTNVLIPYVDGVILVVQPGKTSRNAVRRAKEKMAAMHGQILGVVLNNPKRAPGWTDGYGYGYGYAYAYQDTNSNEGSKDRESLAQAVSLGGTLPAAEDRNKT